MILLNRMFIIFGVSGVLVSSEGLAQSKEQLRRKYGEPISETFLFNPSIIVTATYASKGRIAELLISPRTTGLVKSRGQTMSQESVRAILDELVPNSVRGKFLIGSFLNLTCLPENDCQGSSEDFQNVTIYYNAARDGGVNYAVVQWNKQK